jgi:hypothetical protein
MVVATQFREASTHVSKPPYEPFEGPRKGFALSPQTSINKTESGTIRDGRSQRSPGRLTCCETHLSFAVYRLNPGPSGEDAENVSANLAMSDHLSRASWIDRYRGSKHLMSLATGLSSSGACTRRTAEKRSTMEHRNVHSSLSAIEFLTKQLNYSGRKCGPLVPTGNPRACGRPAQCHGRIHRTNLTKPTALKVSSALITRTSPMCLCRPVIRRRRNPWHWLPVVALSKAPVADQKLRFSEFRTRKRCS